MHWIRVNREALYDAVALAEARAARPELPPYKAVKAPRAAPPNTTCRYDGCDAPVHYGGAACLPCQLARGIVE